MKRPFEGFCDHCLGTDASSRFMNGLYYQGRMIPPPQDVDQFALRLMLAILDMHRGLVVTKYGLLCWTLRFQQSIKNRCACKQLLHEFASQKSRVNTVLQVLKKYYLIHFVQFGSTLFGIYDESVFRCYGGLMVEYQHPAGDCAT